MTKLQNQTRKKYVDNKIGRMVHRKWVHHCIKEAKVDSKFRKILKSQNVDIKKEIEKEVLELNKDELRKKTSKSECGIIVQYSKMAENVSDIPSVSAVQSDEHDLNQRCIEDEAVVKISNADQADEEVAWNQIELVGLSPDSEKIGRKLCVPKPDELDEIQQVSEKAVNASSKNSDINREIEESCGVRKISSASEVENSSTEDGYNSEDDDSHCDSDGVHKRLRKKIEDYSEDSDVQYESFDEEKRENTDTEDEVSEEEEKEEVDEEDYSEEEEECFEEQEEAESKEAIMDNEESKYKGPDWSNEAVEIDNEKIAGKKYMQVSDHKEEKSQNKNLQESEEISSPTVVPRRTGFWDHDNRFTDISIEESRRPAKSRQLWDRTEVNKWQHDCYVENEQGPKEQWEVEESLKELDRRQRGRGRRGRPNLGDFISNPDMEGVMGNRGRRGGNYGYGYRGKPSNNSSQDFRENFTKYRNDGNRNNQYSNRQGDWPELRDSHLQSDNDHDNNKPISDRYVRDRRLEKDFDQQKYNHRRNSNRNKSDVRADINLDNNLSFKNEENGYNDSAQSPKNTNFNGYPKNNEERNNIKARQHTYREEREERKGGASTQYRNYNDRNRQNISMNLSDDYSNDKEKGRKGIDRNLNPKYSQRDEKEAKHTSTGQYENYKEDKVRKPVGSSLYTNGNGEKIIGKDCIPENSTLESDEKPPHSFQREEYPGKKKGRGRGRGKGITDQNFKRVVRADDISREKTNREKRIDQLPPRLREKARERMIQDEKEKDSEEEEAAELEPNQYKDPEIEVSIPDDEVVRDKPKRYSSQRQKPGKSVLDIPAEVPEDSKGQQYYDQLAGMPPPIYNASDSAMHNMNASFRTPGIQHIADMQGGDLFSRNINVEIIEQQISRLKSQLQQELNIQSQQIPPAYHNMMTQPEMIQHGNLQPQHPAYGIDPMYNMHANMIPNSSVGEMAVTSQETPVQLNQIMGAVGYHPSQPNMTAGGLYVPPISSQPVPPVNAYQQNARNLRPAAIPIRQPHGI